MTVRTRLRPTLTPGQMEATYIRPHDAQQWIEHLVRISVTVSVGHVIDAGVRSVADLSCGRGARIARGLTSNRPMTELHLGDFAPGFQYHGPIEETVREIPPVDMFICTETIEHLDEPGQVLKDIAAKSERLVLSTPVGSWDDANPEHYWAWDREGVEDMIHEAGFRVIVYSSLDFTPIAPDSYCFGIWGCQK